ncbi:InlB B-repeat-containing protein [Treponema medium]|uniref:InlB B-repeat-containing protein n=1 Tax=Treponema medium TaxID=58231 RepID=UPI00209184CC|nr:InlB B-repeat-containing protein [Treponema medium]
MPTPEQTETSPVIVDMPLDGVGEKHYVLTYHTAGVGFKPSASTTVYYKVLKEHTVTFDSKGGSGVSSQKILYGSKISPEPAAPTAPSGYTFRNWCIDESCTTAWDFASGTVTSDITLYAKWDPVGGVSYTVQHFQQNINDNNYPTVPSATQTLNGTAGTLTTATANAYAGFEPLPIEQKTITGDGSTVVEVKYKRKRITVTFKLAGGNISGSTDDVPREGKFGATFTMPTNPTKDGYTFNGWTPALSSPPTFPAVNAEYTARWQEIPKPGMHIKEGISAEEKSYGDSGTDDLVPDAGQYTNATPLIIYKESGQAKLSITGSSGTTAYYRIDAESETEKTEISLPADGSAHKLTVWAKKGADDSIKTVLHVQVKDALTTYKELKNVVKHADDGAVINIGNELNCTEESSEIEINKTLTVQRKAIISAPPRYIIDANEKGRFFKVASEGQLTLKDLTLKNGKMSGSITTGIGGGIQVLSGGTCQLTNCIITECKAVNGGALIVAGMCTLTDSIVENNSFLVGGSAAAANVMAAGTLVLEGNTVIKDNKTADGNPDAMAVVITGGITLKDSAQVKAVNNIHLSVETAYITVDENLAASPTAAGVSMPSFSAGRKVLAGTLTPDNIGKFTLVGFYAEQWKINASVTFKAVGGQSQVVTNWIALRKAVQDASDGDVIEIANDITYDFDSMNSTIKVKKDITVKSTEGNKRTLNAHGNGADGETAGIKIKGVFEVSGGKTLTLENVILTLTEKYAVYVAEDSSLTMKNVTIKDCKTQDNAAGIYFNKGKDLILENCRIEKCKGKGSQSSGAIDIQAPKETVSIKDTAIKNCEANGANSTGGGIHLYNVNNAQCTLENVTVDSCSALSGGGVYAEKGTLTISGGSFTENTATSTAANGGGGAIYNKGSEITITNCIIGGDNDGNMALRGAGIFVSEDAKCILKAGVKIQNNIADGADSSGGGIFVSKNADSTQFGTLTIKGTSDNPVTISENKAEYGGGLYNFGTVTIKNAKIEKNEVPHHGGGMVNAETCTMDSVKLENNKAGSEGGGIYSSKVLTLKDTTVTGNTAKMYGGGIHIGAGSTAFNMSGSSVITADPSKNDVYLADDLYITLTGELTAGEETFARITLNSSGGNGYKAGRVVVKGGVGFNITADYKNKFTITDKLTNPKKWELDFIGSELKLKKK